jgi:hypothetical protein
MKTHNRISIRQILDDILAHPMLQDITLERAVNYAIEFIRIVGMPDAFERKTSLLKVANYQADLTKLEGCYQILSIRNKDTEVILSSSSSLFDLPDSSVSPYYVLRGNVLQTSIKEGELEISYLGIPVDDDGFPTIPNIASYIRALEAYIKKQWFTILFDLGKLHSSILSNTQQEYAWAVGQAQSELASPSLDEVEAFTNMWNSLLPQRNPYLSGFKTLGSRTLKRF